MNKAIQTFCEFLGLRLINRHAGIGEIEEIAFVEEPHTGHRMELVLKPNGVSGELDHIAFEVKDIEAEFERLKLFGLVVRDKPTDISQGDFLFKKIHSRSCRVAHFIDANGLRIQIVQYD